MKDFESVRQYDNTFIWSEGQLAFMCIGKAANSSIKAAVLSTMGGVDPSVSVHFDERLEYISNVELLDYPFEVVAVVRNPLDRLVSFWRDKIACRDECNFEHLGLYPGMSFMETARIVLALPDTVIDSHITPQTTLLYYTHTPTLAPRLIHYEELAHGGWATIQKMAAVPLPDLPHFNRSNPIPVEIPEWLEEKINAHYHLDRSAFGYR